MTRYFTWQVEISVAENVVADGLDLDEGDLHDTLMHAFPYVFEHEIRCRMIKAPDENEIAKVQGYDGTLRILRPRKV